MKLSDGMANFLGVFFIALGLVWISCIAIRCQEISPVFSLSKAVSGPAGPAGEISKPVIKARSPFAKPYHDIIFKAICLGEVFVAIFYITAGIFLLKRYVLAKFVVFFVLALDVFLKMLVILFMKFGAIPLSQLTHNPNLLELYFMPSSRLHSSFSAVFSGLQVYLSFGLFYLVCEIFYFGTCLYFVSRADRGNFSKTLKKA